MGVDHSFIAVLGGALLALGCGKESGNAGQTDRGNAGGASTSGTNVVQGGAKPTQASGSSTTRSTRSDNSSGGMTGFATSRTSALLVGGNTAFGGSASTNSVAQAGAIGAHCATNGAYTWVESNQHQKSCYIAPETFEIPNPSAVFGVRDIALVTPMVANVPYAISEALQGHGPLSLELWGTDAECGKGKELLWWAPMQSGIVCAEFTPSADHSHVLAVLRQLRDADFFHYHAELGLCPQGTCPAGANGYGRTAGTALSAPLGGYEPGAGMSNYRTSDASLLGGGQLTLVSASGGSALKVGEVRALTHGVFRLPAMDPEFGDAWYCLGEGSSMTQIDEKNANLSFKHITRLADCAKKSASNTAYLSITDNRATVASSLADLASTDLGANQRCVTNRCRFSVTAAPKFAWLGLETTDDLGTYSAPTRVTADIVEAQWLVQESDDAPFRMACATTGTVYYDPDATTEVTLSNLSEFVACPGEPIANDSLEISLQ